MNKKLVLALLASPNVLSSILLTVNPAQAAETMFQATTHTRSAPAPRLVCSHSRCVSSTQLVSIGATPSEATPLRELVFKRPIPVAYAQPIIEYPMTEEESNAAIALFGCDCPSCVNALRALRGLQPYT